MKKVILIILLFAPKLAVAQFSFGPQQGVNISNIDYWSRKNSYYDNVDIVSKAGVNIGLYVEEKFTKHVGITSGLFFNNVGYIEESVNWRYSDFVSMKTVTNSISFISVPIDFLYTWNINELRLLLYSGPGIGLTLSKKVVTEISHSLPNSNDVESEKSRLNDYLLFYSAGIGLEYNKLLLKTTFEAIGFNEDFKRLQNFNVSLGYLFCLRKK